MQADKIANRYEPRTRLRDAQTFEDFLAHDASRNRPVFLKLLKPEAAARSPENVFRYRRLQRELVDLRQPNLGAVLDCAEWNGRVYVVLEACEDGPFPEPARDVASADRAVKIVRGLAGALHEAHERGLLHGHLNRESVAFDASGAPKLIDFGAGLLLDLTAIRTTDEVRRVFRYLAPEQSGILRKPADARSDLYSLGIVFYELLTGQPPYTTDEANALISEHVSKAPSPLRAPGLSGSALEKILFKLIAKDPEDRYQTAAGLLADLDEYAAHRRSGTAPVAFEIGLHDRLRKPTFSTRLIGRERELARLREAVAEAKSGRGSVAFIHGEPGIGKTRLINELRAEVHSLGGFFVAGKCSQYDAGAPFKVLSMAIESYVERVRRLSAGERAEHSSRVLEAIGELGAEVVKLTPRARELIGEPPELAQLEPNQQRNRFMITTVNFLAALANPGQPFVLFLDDLQWSDEGSCELLERLFGRLEDHGLIVIVSYRDTEVDAAHPVSRLQEVLRRASQPFTDLAVKAFDANETREMVSRVLLETPDRVDGLARYLLARTQGNPFFILELLRTLIDERVVRYEDGRCRFEQAELERVDLPDNLVDAVLRRVRDLPPSDLEVLSLAAVVGKEVQLELLSSLTTRRIEDLVGTIDRAVDHQILARDIAEEDSVAFVHDRVREAFYGRVDNVSELHGRIARELESRNPEGGGRVVYDLAYHYGRGEQSEKALDYSLKAAAMAAQSTAHDLAVHLYGQARGLLESKSQTDDPRYLDALEGLGEASRLSGKFTEAIDVLKICVRLVPKQDRLRLTRVLAKLADAHFERAEAVMATKLIERALRGVGIHLPKSRLAMRCGILWEFLVQMIHTARPRRRAKPGAPPSALEEITTRLLSRLTYISYFHDSEKTFYVYLRNLNRCENLPPSTMLAAQYALAGPIWSSIPWFWKARRDLNLGIEMSKAFNDRHQEACSYSYFISVCHLMNEPALGIEYSSKAIGILRRIGEYYDLGVAYVFREHCNSVYTRYSKAVADNEEFLRVIRDCGVPQPLTWALTYKSYHHSIAGTLTPEGLVEMQKSVDDNEAMGDKPSSIAGYGHLAFAYSRMGQLDRALSVVGHIEELMRAYDMRAPWILELWPICAEIHMEVYLRDRASDPAKAADHLERARRYCDEARRAGGKFRYVYGWAWQVSGTYWWITGRKSRALRAWDRGIRYVRHHPCDFRLGCLLREAARWIRTEDPKSRLAQEYLLEAKEAFEAADCLKDAEEVAALLHGAKQREVHRTRQALTFKRHLESLLSVTQAIGSVFDLKELLQQILSYAMEVSGSERGCILLRAEASSALELRVGSGWSREVAAKPFSYESYGVSLALIERVRQKGEALVAGAKDGGEAAEELAASGVRQAMAVPLRTKEKDLGFLYLDNQMADGVFGEEELELMKSFAIQAAVSIENTSLVQSLVEQDRLKQEMQLGQEIQQGFLPKEAPVVTGLKVAAFMQPAREIGGDYYDFILRPGNNGSSPLAVVIGDVTGKGLGAGLNMAMVKTTLLTLSREEIGLGEILTKANRILHGQMTFGTFISLLYLQWNPAMRALSFAAAGHCDPLVLRAATSKVERIPSGGIALGLIPEIESKIQERALPLAPGDHVLLFTDGVIEAQNARGEEFGMERLTEAVQRHGPRGAAGLAAGLREDVAAFIGSEAQYDDITLIVLEVDR